MSLGSGLLLPSLDDVEVAIWGKNRQLSIAIIEVAHENSTKPNASVIILGHIFVASSEHAFMGK